MIATEMSLRKEFSADRVHSDQFKTLTSLSDVRHFLNARGHYHHKGYFQYTNLRAAQGMIQSKMLHLSLATTMNDLLEPLKTVSEKWKRTYIACFAFGKFENVAMWTIYGNPLHDAIRVCFPCAEVNHDVALVEKGQSPVYGVVEKSSANGVRYDYEDLNIKKPKIVLHDVAYTTGKSYFWDERKLRGSICPAIETSRFDSKMRGYIKSYAWKYEHETRIVVTLPDAITNPPKQLAIPFASAIANTSFTLGPCTTASHAEEFGLANCHQSSLHGLVRMKGACTHCDYNKTTNCPTRNI